MDFRSILKVKKSISIVFDPSDEIISMFCSSYIGVLFLLYDLYEKSKHNKCLKINEAAILKNGTKEISKNRILSNETKSTKN